MDHLLSPQGGSWWPNEIRHINLPDRADMTLELIKLKGADYSLVYFTGHGYYSGQKTDTVLELKHGVEIESKALLTGVGKQSIILDCCRVIIGTLALEKSMAKFAASGLSLNPENCRKAFDKAVEDAPGTQIITHACKINETAGDDSETGGVYTHRLLRKGYEWAAKQSPTWGGPKVLSLVENHDLAERQVRTDSQGKQNPTILAARTGPYLPFVVSA